MARDHGELRQQILEFIYEYHREQTHDDEIAPQYSLHAGPIAAKLGRTRFEINTQLQVLEKDGFVQLVWLHGMIDHVRLTGAGVQRATEGVNDASKASLPSPNSRFDSLLLEPEQESLLASMVQASRNVPSDRRHKFLAVTSLGQPQHTLMHEGFPGGDMNAYIGDVETLDREGLLALSYTSQGDPTFDVTPLGFRYYEHLKLRSGEPIQRIEAEIRSHLNAQLFRTRYPQAYQKWSEAENHLWSSESQRQLTTIGHLCREAGQEFATRLVELHQPPAVDSDKSHDVARIRAVLHYRAEQVRTTVKPFLEALLHYWRTVSDLVQRQEHGSQREAQPLRWEDARRLVFQTAIVMFEMDRALQ